MPRGGHNRRSPRKKRLAGTARPDRARPRRQERARSLLYVIEGGAGAASPAAETPRPPVWLKPVARAKWTELAPRLVERGILTELSRDLLANACMHWEMMVRCYHRVSRDGAVVQNRYGRMVKHPALQVLRENSAAFRDCLSRMGMTPVDVGKVEVDEPDDGADAFFGTVTRR